MFSNATNNEGNNPIVRLYYGLSRPCINVNKQFMNRSSPIPLIYRTENNDCDMYYETMHSEYKVTGLSINEGAVYKDNKYYDDLERVVPRFKAEDLELNQYTLYQKPYALWSIKCQKVIPTTLFAKMAKDLMDNEERQRSILQLTSFFLGAEYVIAVLIMILKRQITKAEHRKYFNIGVILAYFVTMGMLISILAGYLKLFSTLHFDRIEVIEFVNR